MNKGGPPCSSARNHHGNDHLTWRGVLSCCFFCVCAMCTPLSQAQAMARGSSFGSTAYSPLR